MSVTVVQEIRGVFDLLDQNKDGFVLIDDLRTALQKNCNITLYRREMKRMLKLSDGDRDGRVSFQDFLHMYVQLMTISMDTLKSCDKHLWSQYMEYLGSLDTIMENAKIEMGKEASKVHVESGEKSKPQEAQKQKNIEEEKRKRDLELENIKKEKELAEKQKREREEAAEKERIRVLEEKKRLESEIQKKDAEKKKEDEERIKKEEDKKKAEQERIKKEHERIEKEKHELVIKKQQEEVARQEKVRLQEERVRLEQENIKKEEIERQKQQKDLEARLEREKQERIRKDAEKIEEDRKKKETMSVPIDVTKSQVVGSAWFCMVFGVEFTIKFFPRSAKDQPCKSDKIVFRISTMADDDDEEGGVIDTIKPVDYRNEAYIFKYTPTEKLNHIWYTFEIFDGEDAEEVIAQSQNVLIGSKKKVTTEIDKLQKKIQQLHIKQNDSAALGMETSLGGQIGKLQVKVDAYKALLSEISE